MAKLKGICLDKEVQAGLDPVQPNLQILILTLPVQPLSFGSAQKSV